MRNLALAETALSAAVARVRAEKDVVMMREEVERQLQQAGEAGRAGATGGSSGCVVCMEVDRSMLILPCRHMCLCAACARNPALTRAGARCPVCRAPIDSFIAVFAS